MHLISWNVNGLRSACGGGFNAFLADHQPDIVCLQEVKISPNEAAGLLPPGWHVTWNPAVKKGYSGVATLSRQKPRSVSLGLGDPAHDVEGRVVTSEFDDVYVVNVYTPNSQRELLRLDYRVNQWDPAFLRHVRTLQKRKPVLFCGDLNVSHREIDLANPRQNRRNAGFTDEERAGFDRMIDAGFLDSFRVFEPETPGRYSWWTYRMNARARNIGWRLDYVMASSALRPRLTEAFILSDVKGSDHCPVGVRLEVRS